MHNLATAVLVFAIALLLYIVTNQLTGSRQGITFVTPVDAVIPFLPAAFFGFLLFFPLFLFPFLFISEAQAIRRIAWGVIICTVVVLAVFFALPTRVPRPGIPTQEKFLYWLVAFLYVCDNPVNCLPGFSLTISIFVTFCTWSVARAAGWLCLGATAVVVVSGLLLRQHYLADVLASLIIGYMVFRFFARPALRNLRPASLALGIAAWQSLALRLGIAYLALVGLGLLLFEIGVRFNPVLPTN